MRLAGTETFSRRVVVEQVGPFAQDLVTHVNDGIRTYLARTQKVWGQGNFLLQALMEEETNESMASPTSPGFARGLGFRCPSFTSIDVC